MELESKQPVAMKKNIEQGDNLIIQENKVEIKKEPEGNGEKSQNFSNILNRMVQFGDKIFVPVDDMKMEPNSIKKIKKEKIEAQEPFDKGQFISE